MDRRMLDVILWTVGLLASSSSTSDVGDGVNVSSLVPGFQCDFDAACAWTWDGAFRLSNSSSAGEATSGDGKHNVTGQFLQYEDAGSLPGPLPGNLSSPWLKAPTERTCNLQFWYRTSGIEDGAILIFLANANHTKEVGKVFDMKANRWKLHRTQLGRLTTPFRVSLEVIGARSTTRPLAPSLVGIDDIQLVDCTKSTTKDGTCSETEFRCPSSDACIEKDRVCDFSVDCQDGEDENQDCDKIPSTSRCTFENTTDGGGMCSWRNLARGTAEWTIRTGEDTDPRFGIRTDHTTGTPKGHFACASGRSFGHEATLESIQFDRLPYYHLNKESAYYNSCHVNFFYQMDRRQAAYGFTLYALEFDPRHAVGLKHEIWSAAPGDRSGWRRVSRPLPHMRQKYRLHFVVQTNFRRKGCTSIDDISMTPECFGIGVPENETREFPPESPGWSDDVPSIVELPVRTYPGNISRSYNLTTCGVSGRFGPSPKDCSENYTNVTRVQVLTKSTYAGVQVWKVPESGLYTVFAQGARGGLSVGMSCNTSGTLVRATFHWEAGERIHAVVGQRGADACESTERKIRLYCQDATKLSALSNIHMLSRGGGGGGGGATALYKVDVKTGELIPLVVAAGGGGAAGANGAPPTNAKGRGFQEAQSPGNGLSAPERRGAGGGGGWNDSAAPEPPPETSVGRSLVEGGIGGLVCLAADLWNTNGGFGGGGGGCAAGGGGGGWKGGDASLVDSAHSNGQGGTSYVHPESIDGALLPSTCVHQDGMPTEQGLPSANGAIVIVPATGADCPCKDLCMVVHLWPPTFRCACARGLQLARDGLTCQGIPRIQFNGGYRLPTHHLVVIILCIVVTVAVIIFFVVGLPRCPGSRKKSPSSLSPEPLGINPEVQLSRLRQATGMVTEYNPNYEFGGSTCTLQDLNDIPRENLTLVKALGQGAFGEVYQGFLGGTSPEALELPVAVKTLPELSSPEAEKDFVTEACIMSKFNHPNIVRFIGVCFEKMPRFIVLELLPGGDLKSFLRESRPKPNTPSQLTMTDLLKLAIDVAKGCQYLEDKHFIHRDIAARNCLLTTKGPERVVKIADFGMARDIYRADYYRKGGKAMLPVKWMPPEAFLDGMFTSKTDVWSFGVLLWEVMSMGYMPYPGRGNQEVMQLVTSGGRLEPPANCPGPVYHVMTQCWHPTPDERPTFSTILERLGYCIQDPDVTAAPLPVFHRPPSMERDATVMRPPNADNVCLQVYRSERSEVQSPGSEDYLIPMPSSNYSLSTERTELQSASSSLDSMDKLLGDKPPPSWETSFTTTSPDELPIRTPLQQPYSNIALHC
ncbi:leukocyte tyrosine kinase receptor-like isoform X2 [Ornithodoros turicata]|uniref:leukocyte tyrosine kinase receptor-like isoform X2 n=1 Tax=Ornithodoros turicata TaxID=34597 RepID=UPI00313A4500